MKHYTFTCYDDEDGVTTTIELSTDNDCWHGFNGPMWRFFDFLKGCGFVFHHNANIGVMDESGEFKASVDI